jgi:hypothetical protein
MPLAQDQEQTFCLHNWADRNVPFGNSSFGSTSSGLDVMYYRTEVLPVGHDVDPTLGLLLIDGLTCFCKSNNSKKSREYILIPNLGVVSQEVVVIDSGS